MSPKQAIPDGSVETLDQAILEMAEHQICREAVDEFVKDVKAFLGSLTAKDMK